MKRTAMWFVLAACGGASKGAPGAQGPAGQQGAQGNSGSQGSKGDDGTGGTNGVDGQNGQPGPIDASVPPTVSGVRLRASPLGPPSYELAWNLGAARPALSAVKIYRGLSAFDDTTKVDVGYDTASGAATHATVQIAPDSGPIYFGIAAVSYTGIEGPVALFVFDSTVRICAAGAIVAVNNVRCVGSSTELTAANQAAIVLSPTGTGALVVGDDGATLGFVDFEQAVPSVQPITTKAPLLQPAFSPDGSLIAFLSDADESNPCLSDLYVVPAQPSATPLRLTGSGTPAILRGARIRPAICSRPVGTISDFQWSPDGSQLFYLTRNGTANELHTISPSGGASVNWMTVDPANQITDGVVTAAFSPDAKFIAFTTFDGSNAALRIADLATHTLRLVLGFLADAQSFAWSWDSARLAAMSDNSPTPIVFSLSDGSAYSPDPGEVDSYGSQGLSFSPDGHWLAAVGEATVVVFPTDSFVIQVLFDSTTLFGGPLANNLNSTARGHGWSADSRYFAFTVANDGSDDGVHFIDTTNGQHSQVQITLSVSVSWLADGSAVTLNADGNVDVVAPPSTIRPLDLDLGLAPTFDFDGTVFAPPPPAAP